MEEQDEYDDEYGTCEETYASLRIQHDALDPHIVSQLLGIQPTWAWQKGEMQMRSSGINLPTRSGIWGLSTKETIQSYDLRRHIDWLGNQVATRESVFEQFHKLGYKMDVFCLWISTGHGGGPTLSPRNIQWLAAFGLEIGFDFYSGGDDENNEEV